MTIKELSEHTGFSTATISRFINHSGYVSPQTAEQLKKAFETLGYHPRTKGSSKRYGHDGGVIGISIPEYNEFFTDMIRGVQSAVSIHNITIVVCDAQNDPARELLNLQSMADFCVGLIIAPVSMTTAYNAEFIMELNKILPVILCDTEIAGSFLDGVFVDSYTGACNGVRALIRAGHKEIGLLAGKMSSKTGIDRFNGYESALQEAGLTLNEENILYADYSQSKAYELMKRYLKRHRKVTGVFSSNYLMTLGCLRAFEEYGIRVPEDMALLSFDDAPVFCWNKYQISAIVNPGTAVGSKAVGLLLERMKNKRKKRHAPQRVQLIPQLVLRGSEILIDSKKRP